MFTRAVAIKLSCCPALLLDPASMFASSPAAADTGRLNQCTMLPAGAAAGTVRALLADLLVKALDGLSEVAPGFCCCWCFLLLQKRWRSSE
jgi:hypothetical protein